MLIKLTLLKQLKANHCTSSKQTHNTLAPICTKQHKLHQATTNTKNVSSQLPLTVEHTANTVSLMQYWLEKVIETFQGKL
jgi:hypothetical protein